VLSAIFSLRSRRRPLEDQLFEFRINPEKLGRLSAFREFLAIDGRSASEVCVLSPPDLLQTRNAKCLQTAFVIRIAEIRADPRFTSRMEITAARARYIPRSGVAVFI